MLDQFTYIIGPCSLESYQQMLPIADLASHWGLTFLRAPLFKPRTHPDSFQGLGQSGLTILKELEKKGPFQWVSEILSIEHLDFLFSEVAMLQIGARNMQNFELLKAVGLKFKNSAQSPYVLLKRGFGSTIEEWAASALYLERHGVPKEKILLCERGTRNFASPTGVTLDFALALEAKKRTGLKVIIDPSHGTRSREWALPMVKATHALGLDGVMLEVHPDPDHSVSDAHQALSLESLENFFSEWPHGPRGPL